MGRKIILVLLLASTEFISVRYGMAQGETTSAILGQVTDASGAAIPGATVSITNRQTSLQRSVQTDAGALQLPTTAAG